MNVHVVAQRADGIFALDNFLDFAADWRVNVCRHERRSLGNQLTFGDSVADGHYQFRGFTDVLRQTHVVVGHGRHNLDSFAGAKIFVVGYMLASAKCFHKRQNLP